MLKTIIKRDGSKEDFTPIKIMRWAQWSSEHLRDRVNWSEIVAATIASSAQTMTSQELQLALVKHCALKHDWAHNLMAGRLYSAYIHKKTFPAGMPTVKEQFEAMAKIGLMKSLDYSDQDYEQMQSFINHDKDFGYAYFQVEQIYKKYSLQNRVTKQIVETPQFTFMRMAAAICVNRKERLKGIKAQYEMFSNNFINAPTPNYLNLGTPHNGLASCCLYTTDDSISSLNAGNTIAYVMTAQSAGIGGFINTRSLGDPVRKGSIAHQGKTPYYKDVAGSVTANIQAGRGGACTQYYSAYDPEAITIAMLQNEMSPDNKRNRDIHFAVMTNKWLAKKAAAKESVFSFNVYTAPELMKALFSGDDKQFEELYNKYENDPSFVKKYTPAVDLVTMFYNQHNEVGTHYELSIDEANRHTPFLDPIHSSNLCAAYETLILTKEYGEIEIGSIEGRRVNIWNGQQWSEVTIVKTGVNQRLLSVYLSSGRKADFTHYHKWYIQSYDKDGFANGIAVKQTQDLKPGDRIIDFILPDDKSLTQRVKVLSVQNRNRIDDTYCFTEPLKHMGIFAGVLTGNCTEILEPTAPYKNVFDLDKDYDPGFITVKVQLADKQELKTFEYTQAISIAGQYPKQAGDLKVDDIIRLHGEQEQVKVVEIVEKQISPEVAMCTLGGINVAHDYTDEQYEELCYQSLVMIDECIHIADYPLKHIGYTSKKRLNAAVGLIGVATYLAKRNLKYSSKKGKEELHRLAERHAYFCIKASLRLSKELGVAPWMHKTKWPRGWLPIDTYKKTVDEIVQVPLQYDWEKLRQEIIANGGIRNSTLIANMPTESSSKGAGVPNSMLPIRDLFLKKKDQNLTIDWVAVDSDLIGSQYELAFDIPMKDMLECYAIVQKFTDQTTSADTYRDRVKNPKLMQSDLLEMFLMKTKYGIKSLYYANSKTSVSQTDTPDKGCASGACTL